MKQDYIASPPRPYDWQDKLIFKAVALCGCAAFLFLCFGEIK